MPSTPPIHVLVVDDEPDLCDISREFLEGSHGLCVDTIGSVAEARKALGLKHYDAIVSDYQMPIEDGIQFLKSLRGNRDHIPFILFTGKGREDVVIEALNNGADSYLQKGGKPAPLYSELAHRIHTAVGKRKVEADLELKNAELQRTNEELAAAEEEMAAQLEEIRAGVDMMEEAQMALRESERRQRSLFANMLSGAAIHEIICDAEGVPVDYRFLDLNVAFERMTGLRRTEILGKRVREMLPNIEPSWIERYGKVALEGAPVSFESSSQDLGRRYEVTAYRNAPRQFTTIISDVTERKRADEELRKSRKTLADIIDFLPDATFVVDLEGKVLAWNRAIEKMTGVEKVDMIGKGDHEFSIPFYGKRRLQLLDLLTLDDAEIKGRYDFITKDGDTLYAETYCNALNEGRGAHVWAKATSLLDEEGKRIGAIESIRDITERKSVESSLKESEEKYRNLVVHSGDPIFNFDPDETYRFVNQAFSAPFGKKPEEIIGKTPHALFPHDEAERRLALVRQVFQSGKRGEIEVKVITSTGEERHFLTMADPMIDDVGKVLSVSCIAKDITERKRVENELKQSQHLLLRILDTTPNLIYIYDLKQHRNIYANREVAEFLGYSPQQIRAMGANLFDIIMHPDDLKVVMEQQERLRHATEGEISLVEYRLRGADGSWRWVRSRDVIFEREADGTIVSELGIAEDITERKHVEEALRESNRKLGLLSGITRHDIVNQLVLLQGHLGLLETSRPELAHNDHVRKSMAAAARISAMVQFTKEYEDIGIKAPTWVSPGRQAKEAFAALHPMKVALADDTNEAEIMADPLAEKVPYNLIDNSLRHGERVTRIRMSAEQRGDAMLIVYEDDGVGISGEDKQRLFEKGIGKNSGFGLFLCREILAITGITITETGEAGQGVRFEMLVPAGAWRWPSSV